MTKGRHVLEVALALAAALLIVLAAAVPRARAEAQAQAVPPPPTGTEASEPDKGHWLLDLSLGVGIDRGSRPDVSPNGTTYGVSAQYRFGAVPFALGGHFRQSFGRSQPVEGTFGGHIERSRLRLGVSGGVFGEMGDFDLQLKLSLGRMVDGTGNGDRWRWFIAPGLSLLRPVTRDLWVGTELAYVHVPDSVDAAEIMLVAGLYL